MKLARGFVRDSSPWMGCLPIKCYFPAFVRLPCESYVCQLSRIMHESHACRSKIVIWHIQTNFSGLTDTSEWNCLKRFKKLSEHLWNNAQDWLEILWKSSALFWSRRKICLHLLLFFGSHREIFGNHGNLWQSSEVFQKLRQSSEAVSKSLEIQVLWRKKFSRVSLKKSWQVHNPLIPIHTTVGREALWE